MRTKSGITRIICALIAALLLASFSLSVFAEAEANKKLYIKDVKLIYAESIDEAKSYVPGGYTLLENDLNAGADSDNVVYFAYSTTTNPDEAVTDIKMMNMKGGFVLSDYEEQMKNVKDNVKRLANDVKISAELFAENYVIGTYGAKAAYRALSAFTVDEADGMTLADYIIYKKPAEEFYIKFILNVHKDVLSAVISALTMAVQGERGNTWLDRLAKVENPKTEELPNYWNNAEDLWEQFCGFYDVYVTINHALYDGAPDKAPEGGEDKGEDEDAAPPVPEVDPETQPEIEYNGTEALYEVVYRTLKSYKFGSGVTFSEWFLSDEVFDDELIENFFVILSVMTPEELAMLRLSGPLYTVLSTGMDEAAYNEYVKSIDEATGGAPACSIWAGVNTDLFHSSIGITDDAARKIAETEYERELNNDGDSTAETGLKTAGLIAACGAVALGLSMVTYYAFGSLMFTCFSGATLTTAATVVSVGAQIFMMASLAIGALAVAVALVVAIVFFAIWLHDLYEEHHPEYTEIPEYMYDYVEDGSGNNQFILYDSVKFQDGKVADVNTWEGREWHAMYTSHDKAAGAPIEAEIVVKYGNGEIDKDFAGLSNFGHVNAQNLNAYDFDDDVDGVYVTYRQADLEGDYARKPYLSDVKLFSGEEPEKVKNDLMDEGYVCHEVNLTPNTEDYITYLGYKTTNNASRALTDIRLAYGYNSQQYSVGPGNATYAASGSTADGMLTLYITSISQFGTPIRSDFLVLNDRNVPAGYEPVNLFVGGPAVNLNLRDEKYVDSEKPFYLYFLPSKTYKSGTQYLGGLTMIYDQATKTGDNGEGSIENANKNLGYTILHKSKSKNTLEGAFAYTTTYNPYRAIYAITAIKESEAAGHEFSKTMLYDGIGYSLVDRFVVNLDGEIRYEYYTDSTVDGRLYTACIYQGGKPLSVSDLLVSTDATSAPEGYYSVSDRLSSDGRPVDLAKGFYRKFRNSHAGGQPTTFSFEPFYLFIKGEGYKEGNYLTDLYLVSKEELLYASKDENGKRLDIDCDDLDNAYVMDQLSALGAHTAILKNLNLEDSDNLTYLGYTKKAKDKKSSTLLKPITNIILYYAGETDAVPSGEMVFDKITYTLVGNVNLFCEEEGTDEVCERVYLYYTTNPAAGSPIIDIKIDDTAILNGWETVITQNKKALYNDMDDYEDSMWFIHVKRNADEPKYISEIVVGVGGSEADAKAELLAAGCDYMLEKDFNNNVGAHSDYVFIGYKRTNDPNMAIRNIISVHDEDFTTFTKNGALYSKIEGNLNSYTNVFADDIYLFYTKDANAGTPITSLGTSRNVANWSHGEGNRYVVKTVLDQNGKASDLNDGAGGDYIYLLQTRDKQDEQGRTASMIGSGSLIIIVAMFIVSAAAIAWICVSQKKKRSNAALGAEGSSESD